MAAVTRRAAATSAAAVSGRWRAERRHRWPRRAGLWGGPMADPVGTVAAFDGRTVLGGQLAAGGVMAQGGWSGRSFGRLPPVSGGPSLGRVATVRVTAGDVTPGRGSLARIAGTEPRVDALGPCAGVFGTVAASPTAFSSWRRSRRARAVLRPLRHRRSRHRRCRMLARPLRPRCQSTPYGAIGAT